MDHGCCSPPVIASLDDLHAAPSVMPTGCSTWPRFEAVSTEVPVAASRSPSFLRRQRRIRARLRGNSAARCWGALLEDPIVGLFWEALRQQVMGQGLVVEVCKLSLDQLKQVLCDQGTGRVPAERAGDAGALTCDYPQQDDYDVFARDAVHY